MGSLENHKWAHCSLTVCLNPQTIPCLGLLLLPPKAVLPSEVGLNLWPYEAEMWMGNKAE